MGFDHKHKSISEQVRDISDRCRAMLIKLLESTTSKLVFLVLVALLLVTGSRSWIDGLQAQKLITTQLQQRNIGLGENHPPSEPYKASPFAVDEILESSTDQNIVLLELPQAVGQNSQTEFTEFHRFYLASAGKLIFQFIPNEHSEKWKTPQIFIYDDTNNLVAAWPFSGEGNSNLDTERGLLEASFALPSGLYRVKQHLSNEMVSRVEMAFLADRAGDNSSYEKYLSENIKTVHLKVLPGQAAKFGELRKAQEISWSRSSALRWSKRFLPSPKESVQAHIKSERGSWAVAEIALSGRNKQHKSENGLASLDVNVRAGELPYGLRRFKLYVLQSKTNGLDMFIEQFLGDTGLPMYREDLVRVVLNGEYLGITQLWESVDTHLFENAQIAEGPIVSYKTDALIANRGHSWFQPRNYYKPKSLLLKDYPDIGTIGFAQSYCQGMMAKALSFGLYYGGMHGLGSDTRYHFNPRKNCVAPLYKDFNAGIYSIPIDSNRTIRKLVAHPVFRGLTALSVLLPSWRPYTPTYASYYVYRRDGQPDIQQGYFLWTVVPPVMNFSNVPDEDEDFKQSLRRWYSPQHKERLSKRLDNFRRGTNFLNSQGEVETKFSTLIKYPLLEDSITWDKWSGFFSVPEDCVMEDSYLAKIINVSSDSNVQPTCRELHRLDWRNGLLMEWAASKDFLDVSSDTINSIFTTSNKKALVSFLFQRQEEDKAQLFFVERNCGAECEGEFFLKDDETNELIKPSNVQIIGESEFSISLLDTFLNNINEDERLKVFYFEIPKSKRYQHLIPQYRGAGYYFGSYGLAIPPADVSKEIYSSDVRLQDYFSIDGAELKWKKESGIIRSRIVISENLHWKISEPLVLDFAKGGCLEVRGQLHIAEASQLRLKSTRGGWDGIHFINNSDLNLRNLIVEDAGHNQELVYCGDRKYTGAVTFFNVNAKIDNLQINNNRAEDALHILRSQVLVENSKISSTRSDAIDADFSAVEFRTLTIANAGELGNEGGDGIDVSGTLALIVDSQIADSTDKNISLGERSNVVVKSTQLTGGEFGIAVKDASTLGVENLSIKDTARGIALYSKKPFFEMPRFVLPDDQVLFSNVKNEVVELKTQQVSNSIVTVAP